jgi:hypothetical protein
LLLLQSKLKPAEAAAASSGSNWRGAARHNTAQHTQRMQHNFSDTMREHDWGRTILCSNNGIRIAFVANTAAQQIADQQTGACRIGAKPCVPGVWCRRSRLQLGKRAEMALATATFASNIISSTIELVSSVCTNKSSSCAEVWHTSMQSRACNAMWFHYS